MGRQWARLNEELWFPDPSLAMREGLVAVGGDLREDRLLLAYRSGIFPWEANPLTWWSPDPRGVFNLDAIHISRSLARTLRQGRFDVTVNRAFGGVIEACAAAPRPGQDGTWIVPEFVEAYTRLHRAGHAHSVECWHEGKLVGGIYGVAVGGLFAGESMFHSMPDASKVALVHLARRLKERGFVLFDTQLLTAATEALGARWMPRVKYLELVRKAVALRVAFA